MTVGNDRHVLRSRPQSWGPGRAAKTTIAVITVMVVLAIAGAVAVSIGARHDRAAPAPPRAPTRPGRSASPVGFIAVSPLTGTPPDTPTQQTYDQALASGLAGSSTVLTAEATKVPPAGYSPGWGPLPDTSDPQVWASEFVTSLLSVDFAHQSRNGLGRWLSAEEAPELLPGISPSIQQKVLYLSLFDASAVGQPDNPVPDPATWVAAAHQGLRSGISGLTVQPDPQLGQLIAAGWQPVDQRFAAEDVTGTLTTTSSAGSSSEPFSLVLYVGSAHWHDGYGSVLVTGWKTGA